MPGVQPIFCRCRAPRQGQDREAGGTDRKSTRLNSSHGYISYAVFCLKKKTRQLHLMTSAPELVLVWNRLPVIAAMDTSQTTAALTEWQTSDLQSRLLIVCSALIEHKS